MEKIIVLVTMISTIAALMLGFLGWSYDAHGYGLHPMVAYPVATLFFVAPLVWAYSLEG